VSTFRRILQTLCLFGTALAVFAAAIAACFIAVMGIVWVQEGRLMPEDKRMLAKAAEWLLASLVVAGLTWWAGRGLGGKKDDSFRLVRSQTGDSEDRSNKAFVIAFFIAAALLLWPTTSTNVLARISSVLGWLFLLFLGLHLRIFLHELGHLVVAALFRYRLQKLQVGIGSCLGSFRFRSGLRWEWSVWPYGGFVFAVPQSRKHFRLRHALFIAGGPLMDTLVIWAAYHEITRSFGGLAVAFVSGPAGVVTALLFWWTALSFAAGLLPRVIQAEGRKIWNDTSLLLHVLTASHERMRALLWQCDWPHALESIRAIALEQPARSAPVGATRSDGISEAVTFPVQRARLASRLLPEPG
jgi:hypothetical protein